MTTTSCHGQNIELDCQDVSKDAQMVKVAMLQTMNSRFKKVSHRLKPNVIFVDEAHHAVAKTYLKIFGAIPEAYRSAMLLSPFTRIRHCSSQ